ncbi:MAG: helix-turn-helix transcriptional regulator [Myxococcota bacterium]
MAAEWLHVLEAAYDLGRDEAGWIRGVSEALAPPLALGFGVIGYAYDVRREAPFTHVVSHGFEAELAHLPVASALAIEREPLVALLRNIPRACWISEVAPGNDGGTIRAFFAATRALLGFDDIFGFQLRLGLDQGFHFVFPGRSRPLADLSARRTLAAHLQLAARARADAAPAVRLDARLRPVDLPPALARDRAAAVAAAARVAHLRSDPAAGPDAVDAWRDAVREGWLVLDQVDTDGKRFVLVRRAPLTARERQVARLVAQGRSNKEIAHALGLAPSTVSGVVRAILDKRGLASRVQLARGLAP